MKSEKGITLISLIVYVMAMVVVVATIATITSYFYGNIDRLTTRTEGAKEYTAFNSYLVNEINIKNNKVVSEISNSTKIVFSNGNQFTYQGSALYYNKIKICDSVTSCQFRYDQVANKITVDLVITGKHFNNEYTLKNDI